jgi:hypothetical protein
MNMLKNAFMVLICILFFSIPAQGEILVEDASSVWDESLIYPNSADGVANLASDYLIVEYASTAWNASLLYPLTVVALSDQISDYIFIEYASTIWDHTLSYPNEICTLANLSRDYVIVESASTIWDKQLHSPNMIVLLSSVRPETLNLSTHRRRKNSVPPRSEVHSKSDPVLYEYMCIFSSLDAHLSIGRVI